MVDKHGETNIFACNHCPSVASLRFSLVYQAILRVSYAAIARARARQSKRGR